jgi:hypothetical protein
MRRILRYAVRIYPKSWRDRYQRELDALLEDVRPTWRTVSDVLKGAIVMQIQSGNLLRVGGVLLGVTVLAALLISQTGRAEYRSEAVVLPDWPTLNAEAASVLSRDSLADIIVRNDLFKEDRAKASLEDLALRLRSSVLLIATAAGDGSRGPLRLRVSDRDPRQAQRASAAIAQGFVNANAARLIEQANLPAHPDRPPFATALSVAFAIGVFAAILFAVVQAFHVWKPAAVLGLAGAVLGGAGASALPHSFDGLSVVSCRTTDPAAARNLIGLVTAPQELTVLVQRFHLYPGDSRPEQRLLQSLNINPVLKPHGNPATRTANGSYDINIRFRYSDQNTAQLVTEAIAARLTEADNQQRVGIASEMVAPVFVHAGPPAPSASIGLIAGLVFGIASGGLIGYRRSLA